MCPLFWLANHRAIKWMTGNFALKKNRPSLEPMGISGHCHIWGQPRSVPLENSGQGRARSWPLEMSLGAWMGWGDEGEQDLLYRPVRDTASGSSFQTFSLRIFHASLNSNLVSISPFQRRHIWRVRRGPALGMQSPTPPLPEDQKRSQLYLGKGIYSKLNSSLNCRLLRSLNMVASNRTPQGRGDPSCFCRGQPGTYSSRPCSAS